jgi:penicillin-binding protein 1A
MSTSSSLPTLAGGPKRLILSKRFLVKAGVALAGLGLGAALMLSLAIAIAWPSLPELHAMTDYRPCVPLRVYTTDNVLIGEFGNEHRNVLRFEQIPDVMKQAMLSAEDDGFYRHGGIDWAGMVRAVLINIVKQSKTQGGSTITMQVARNFYLSSEKTYARKFYELLLTLKIESQLSKNQILELYMNQIYLGHRSYGFEAAASTYFGKPLSEVTLAEAALLAGIPKAPARINPITNLERAQARQRYVLGRMRTLGHITPEQYDEALAQVITVRPGNLGPGATPVHGEYPAEIARQLMYSVFQEKTYTRGIDVYTTIDSKAQSAAYRAVRKGVLDYTRRAPYPGPENQIDLPEGIESDPVALDEILDSVQERSPDSDDLLSGVVLSVTPQEVVVARSGKNIISASAPKLLAPIARALAPGLRLQRGSVVYVHKTGDAWEIVSMPALQAALLSLYPQDSAIRAMIGGFEFNHGSFNRTLQAWRQPGSNIKPFLYAAALERGLTPATQISDQPIMLSAAQTGSTDWQPKNDGNRYEPMLTLRQGLYRSKNMVSIRILQAISPDYGRDFLTRFGFERERWPAVLSIALGSGSTTPFQVANAYSTIANGGYRLTPYLIDRVSDRSGKTLMRAQPLFAGNEDARAIDPRTAWIADDMLRGAATSGTASRARQTLKRNDVAGKTGTTNDAVDVWFSGYTPSLITTVWMGFDRPRSLGSNELGSGLALSTWLDYMQPVLKDVPEEKQRPLPAGLIVDAGDFYFEEFPPGRSVASLDLPSNDTLHDFMNNARPSNNVDIAVVSHAPADAPAPTKPSAQLPDTQSGTQVQPIQIPGQARSHPL